MKTVKFFTLGCKVNQYETQCLREHFERSGYKEVREKRKADTYVINTCTVTASADRKSRYYIHLARHQNPKARIVVTGCYAQSDTDEINLIPGVSHIVKNQDKDRITEFLDKNVEGNAGNGCIGISSFEGHTRAFLKIQDGCNNSCSYCKVPLVRGVSRSRMPEAVIAEAKRLVKNGFKEIVLCGICLGAYGSDLHPCTDILEILTLLEKVKGLLRIRLSSIEMADISEAFIRAITQSKKICRHLHIPLQSGDDEILVLMNRKYSREGYLSLIKKIKESIPGISITTDIMVGFPGEEERHFINTLTLLKEIQPARVHSFPYSPRNGTRASDFKNKVQPAVVKERISRLRVVADECSLNYKRQLLGKEACVLIEEHSKENKLYWQGYTDTYIPVTVQARSNLENKPVVLKLKEIRRDCLLAEL